MAKEIWKDVDGFDGLYRISSLGRLQRKNKNGWKPVFGGVKKDGCKTFSLHCRPKNKHRAIAAQALVAQSFLGCLPGAKIKHIDGNKLNNCVSNLLFDKTSLKMDGEVWRDVPNYEGVYKVSNLGRVQSRKKYGHWFLLKRTKNGCGYHNVCLYNGSKRKWIGVHCLLASNLEILTQTENSRHAHRMGLVNCARGEKQGSAKLTTAQVIEIKRADCSAIGSVTKLAKKFGVRHTAISRIRGGTRWQHVKIKKEKQ